MTEPAKTPAAVPVRAPDGSVGTVPKEQLAQALDAGAEVVTPDVLQHAKIVAKYGGVVGTTEAAAAGVARGATLGLSDVAATELTPEEAAPWQQGAASDSARAQLAGLKEANPYASAGSELVGAIAPLALSGGAAAPELAAEEGLSLGRAVRGLGALPRAVEGLGGLAGRGVGYMAGEGLIGRAASMGARGAVEGALYNEGNAISEAALGDHELTAEKLLAGAKEGAIFGGAAGGLLGGLGSLTSARQAEAASKIGGAFEPGAAEEASGGLRGALNDFAEKKAFKSAGPTIADERTVEKFVRGGKNRIGRDMLDYLPDAMGKPLAAASTDEIANGAAAVKEKAGQQIGALIKEADEAGMKAAAEGTGKMHAPLLDGQTLTKRIIDEVYNPLASKVGYEAAAKSVGTYVENLAAKLDQGPLTFEKLQGIRQDLDGLVHRATGTAGNPAINVPIAVEELRSVRRVMENYLVEVGDKASSEMGGSWAARYKAAKGLYQSMGHVERIAGNQVLRAERNATFGLRDTISAAGALAAGHPVLGVATALGSKVFRERGNQILGDLANRVAKLGAIERVVARTDGQVKRHLKNFFTKSPHELVEAAPAAVVKGESLREQYAKKTAEVSQLASNPGLIQEKIAAGLGDIGQYAPNVATALAAKSSTTVAYLASKLPKGHVNPDSLTPHLDTPRVSDAERDRFMRYVRGAEGGSPAVAQDLAHGRLSRESVEAFRVASPKDYAQMSAQIQDQLGALKEPLPYQKELQLRILLGKPTTSPGMMAALEKASAQNDNEEKKERTASPVPFKLTTDMRAASERVEEK